jgi:decaprenylphospho-beta-D-erythro-pentofuranosid-2-ulose 2-reductase
MTTDPKTTLILGAGSDIGRAIARSFAAHGHNLMLAARDVEQLAADANDLRIRYGVSVSLHSFDALDVAGHDRFVAGLPILPDVAVSVVGLLGEQKQSERDCARAVAVMRSNFEGPAGILGALANRFEERGSGTLIGIGSVAGDRGRASNYIYGSAKAGFAAYLSGLRNRLARKGVHVVTVEPGFVDTKMTAGMALPRALTAQPDEVGRAVYDAWERKRDVIYVRPIWRLIMAIIVAIPERVFKRMSI